LKYRLKTKNKQIGRARTAPALPHLIVKIQKLLGTQPPSGKLDLAEDPKGF
jgi:hypothetical protein